MDTIQFITYLQNLVSGCAGFIKTAGYMAYQPGLLLLMSADQTVFTYINIPVFEEECICAYTNKFLGLKEDADKENYKNLIYFFGYNQVFQTMIQNYQYYNGIEIDGKSMEFVIDDCSESIPGFKEALKSTDTTKISLSTQNNNYILFASKSITPLNAGDTMSLSIFKDPLWNNIRIYRYSIYKKKFKLNYSTFMRVLIA